MLALFAVLPFLLSASAAPTSIQKRYSGVHIVSGRDGKCLSAGANPSTGTPVNSVDCHGGDVTKWDINPGSGSVIVTGTNYALDAGSNPGNNGALKVWDSYPGLYQQTWYLTDDNRIAITGGDQCLDEGDNGIQTYQCTTGNTNQVFYTEETDNSSNPPPNGGGDTYYYIHPKNDTGRCVTVQGGYAARDASVEISDCFPESETNIIDFQRWQIPAQGSSGNIHNKAGLCLDAGDNPGAGSTLKLYDCYEGLLQQNWGWDGQVFSLGNGQVIHTNPNSGSSYSKPYIFVYTLELGDDNGTGDLTQDFVVSPV